MSTENQRFVILQNSFFYIHENKNWSRDEMDIRGADRFTNLEYIYERI